MRVEPTPFARPSIGRKSRPPLHSGVALRMLGKGRMGTLGCFLRRDDRVYALTCEHVVARDDFTVPIDEEVRWSPPGDRRTPEDWPVLGRLREVGGMDRLARITRTDSALIEIEPAFTARMPGIGRPSGEVMDEYEAVAVLARVAKLGATTGLTRGRIRGILDIVVQHHDPQATQIRYPRVFEVLADSRERWNLCDRGDSGSVLWSDEDHGTVHAVGMLCSTVFSYKGYAVPMGRILERHRATIVRRARANA